MTIRETSSPDHTPEYLSKKVIINGQPVTLYSKNGLTWLSSPEEIPDVMARLENTRVLLNEMKGEKQESSEKSEKVDKGGKAVVKDGVPPVAVVAGAAAAAASQKPTAARYRMKGPKPRPILKQDGVAITGTPVAPISSSSVQVNMGPDAEQSVKLATKAQQQGPTTKAESTKAKSVPDTVAKLAKALSKAVVSSRPDKKSGKKAARSAPVEAAKKIKKAVKAASSKTPAKKAKTSEASKGVKQQAKNSKIASKATAGKSKKAR